MPPTVKHGQFRKVFWANSRDPQLQDDRVSLALVVIHLNQELPDIHEFHGIFEVDNVGIWYYDGDGWYYDGDGHIDEPIWRQRVIPWHAVSGITLHQVS